MITRKNSIYTMVTSALLCAIGILIPLFSPIKIMLEPASFTLASHVAIFIAMFISPTVAVAVSIGTTIGFFFGGFPIVIVLRALTHIVFALLGAIYLKQKPHTLESTPKAILFSFVISCIHALCEVLIVIPFYIMNNLSSGYYTKGFFTSVILLVGIGSVIHSIVDFIISLFVWKGLKKVVK